MNFLCQNCTINVEKLLTIKIVTNTVRPNKKEPRKSSYLQCPRMTEQCQNQVAQNQWLRTYNERPSAATAKQRGGSLALAFRFVPLSCMFVQISLWEWLNVSKEWNKEKTNKRHNNFDKWKRRISRGKTEKRTI